MKLRQKLAVALASAMVVTAVPVVTFAASTNTIVNKQVGEKDRIYTNGATAPILRIKLDDALDTSAGSNGEFYLDFDGFELDKDIYDASNHVYGLLSEAKKAPNGGTSIGQVKYETKKSLTVKVTTALNDGDSLYIPLFGKVTGDTATVAIDSNNNELTAEVLTFAEAKDRKAVVTAQDLTNIYDEGVIGDIVFTEPYEGVIASKAKGTDPFEIKISLDNQDFEFVKSRNLKVEFSKGFGATATITTVSATISSVYDDEIKISIPQSAFKNTSGNWYPSKGAFKISGLEVRANTKTPVAGDLKIDVDSDIAEIDGLKVATIVNNDTKIYMKDEKVVDITAGKSEEVTFFLEENVEDGILPNHTVDFELSAGYFGTYDGTVDIKKATRTQKVASFDRVITVPTGIEVVDVKMDGEKFIGFTAKFSNAVAPLNSKDKYEFKAPLCVDLDVADATEIKITASAERSIDEEVSTVAAKVIAPIKVTADAMPVKVGLQKQKYEGKIVITETANGKIGRGDLVISTPAEGYKFTEKGEVKVTSGDLVVKNWDVKNDQIIIEVKNASKTASTIEITGFEVEVNRTVPEGTYKIEVAGDALASNHAKDASHSHGAVKVEDFFKVTTPNTEDIKNGALKAVVTTFTAGSTEYTVDGVTKTMDAAAYIQNDRTMVPVRYLSEAFGISEQNILFSDGVVTVIAGEKIVQLKVGSDIITVNGMSIKMDAKAEVKNGRTYVPMKFIAAALGVNVSYDSATKTATFSNKN